MFKLMQTNNISNKRFKERRFNNLLVNYGGKIKNNLKKYENKIKIHCNNNNYVRLRYI